MITLHSAFLIWHKCLLVSSCAVGENKRQDLRRTRGRTILSVFVGEQAGKFGGNVGGVNLPACSGQSTLECGSVNSRETPEGSFFFFFLKGNYTSGDYAAVHNGN